MILDDTGNPFYWHTNKEKKINFNLPIGKYSTDNNIKKMPSFRPYGRGKYHNFNDERFKNFVNDLEVYKHDNPNKASISLQGRFILVDPKFHDSPYKPLKTFTLGHEIAHYFCHSKTHAEKTNRHIHQHIEKQCDEMSANYMLAHGWNPSQISLAVKMLLKGQDRKDCIRDMTTHKKNNFRR